jgi:uncharacterized protein YjbI with pentapeptide repeats
LRIRKFCYYQAIIGAVGQQSEKTTMANKKAIEFLKSGDIDAFNKWVKERRKKGKDALDLNDQNLGGLEMRNADLRDARLNGSNLRKCDLRGANLKRARLRQADLRGANLQGADLTEADLRQARKKGANLKKADLKDARGL